MHWFCYYDNNSVLAGLIDGDGGSGIVILRMATSSYSGTHTGSPIITEVGTDTVLQFVGNGTYTA